MLNFRVMLFSLPLIKSEHIRAHKPHVHNDQWNTKVLAVRATINFHLNEKITVIAIKEHNDNTENACKFLKKKNHETLNTQKHIIHI